MKIATSKINHYLLYSRGESRFMSITTQDFGSYYIIEFVNSPLYALGGAMKMATWFRL